MADVIHHSTLPPYFYGMEVHDVKVYSKKMEGI